MKSAENLLAVYNVVRSFVDIGILSFVFYKAYQIIVKSNSVQIIKSAVIVAISYALAVILNLET